MEENINRIIAKAVDVLGDHERALDWVDHMSATLRDTPRNLSRTEEGTKAVLIHLGGISRHSLT
jgi:uncharacterized protein (DUF2384 family)